MANTKELSKKLPQKTLIDLTVCLDLFLNRTPTPERRPDYLNTLKKGELRALYQPYRLIRFSMSFVRGSYQNKLHRKSESLP